MTLRPPIVSRRAHRGFTLLEVLIATAILALGLASVFGSQIMAARNTAHARMVTQGSLMGRCRMEETEAYLRINQLPEIDQTLDDPPQMGWEPCCTPPFTCTSRIERIELPQPSSVGNAAGDTLLSTAAQSARGTTFEAAGDGGTGGVGGALGAVSQLASAFGAMGGGASDPSQGLAGAMSGGSGGAPPNPMSIMSQLLMGVYPTLKLYLEAAIRRVTVTVRWNEGARPFSFDVVQYVTNPAQSIPDVPQADGGTPPPPPDAGSHP